LSTEFSFAGIFSGGNFQETLVNQAEALSGCSVMG
jgi:hypothetical protein